MAQNLPWKKIIGTVLGLPFTLLLIYSLDILPNKWSGTIVAAYVFIAVAIILGDVKRSLFFVLICGIPLDLQLLLSGYQRRITSSGIFLSVVDVSILGLIILWVIGRKSSDVIADNKLFYHSDLTKPALLYVGANIVSLLVSGDKTWCFYGIVNTIKLFAVFFVVANSIRTEREIKYVMSFLVTSLFIQSAIYIVQHFTGIDFNVLGQSQLSGDFYGSTRERGLMGQANTSGLFFSACLLLGISWYFIQRRILMRILIAITIGLSISGLIITLTRSAWLAFVFSVMIFTIIGIRRKWVKFRAIIPILAILVIIVMGFWDSVTGRFEKHDAGSAYSRIPSMILMTRIIKDHPILGVGVNNYVDARNRYLTEDVREALHYPHNQYLLVFVETGIVGFLGFMWFLYKVFKAGIRSIGSENPLNGKLAAGILMAIVAISIGMLTDAHVQGPVAELMWFLAGLVPAIERFVHEEPGFEGTPGENQIL